MQGAATDYAVQKAERAAAYQAWRMGEITYTPPQQTGGNEPLDSATRSYMAWAKAVEQGKFDTQAYAKGVQAASQSNAATQSQPKSIWQRGGEWVKEKADKIADGIQGIRDSWKVRRLKFTKLESGKISVSAETPAGTRLAYRADVADEGFKFAGTRYNPGTVAATTGKGLLRSAVSRGSLAFAGLVSFGTNLLEFGSGKKFGTPEYWDATVKNREFWVSTAVDFAVSVAVGVAAAAIVAGVIATAPLWLPASAVAIVAAPAVAIVASMGVGIVIGGVVDMTGFPSMAKTWLNTQISSLLPKD